MDDIPMSGFSRLLIVFFGEEARVRMGGWEKSKIGDGDQKIGGFRCGMAEPLPIPLTTLYLITVGASISEHTPSLWGKN